MASRIDVGDWLKKLPNVSRGRSIHCSISKEAQFGGDIVLYISARIGSQWSSLSAAVALSLGPCLINLNKRCSPLKILGFVLSQTIYRTKESHRLPSKRRIDYSALTTGALEVESHYTDNTVQQLFAVELLKSCPFSGVRPLFYFIQFYLINDKWSIFIYNLA